MTKFGALIHTESANATACAKAVADLNLDLVVIGFPYGALWTQFDPFCSSIPQHKILAMPSLPTGPKWNTVTPQQLGEWAASISKRYPGIVYFEVINEPDVSTYYPPNGIPPATYMEYYNAVKAALAAVGPTEICHGPVTSHWLPEYNPNDGAVYFHGYGTTPGVNPSYWMTELDSVAGPVDVWKRFYGYGAAIYYQLQDSPDSPGTGLLDAQGNPRQPWYNNAKAYLQNPCPLPWWERLWQAIINFF